MPGIVRPSDPTLVMPESLSVNFEEVHQFCSLVNTYPDGSSTRKTMHTVPRKKFTLSKRLRAMPYYVGEVTPFIALRNLWEATRRGLDAFYFYNYREGPFDAAGIAEFGRYTVVFRGSFSETLVLGVRGDCNFTLEEVE